MTFDIAELQIHADPQVAFAHYLCHCGGTGPDGQPHSSWMRVSAGYRKQGDGWKVIHEHFSAPFDMDGKALFDLQPDSAPRGVVAGSTQRFTARGLSSEQGLPTR